MLAAVEPEIPVADRGVYEDAMMGLARARMGIRPEMAAADAHALQRNRLHLLQGQRSERVGYGGGRDGEMRGNLFGAQAIGPPRHQGQHLSLRRIEALCAGSAPKVSTQDQGEALESLVQAGRNRIGSVCVIHEFKNRTPK